MSEKVQISARLREEVISHYGSLKAFSDAIGKSQQYLNIYLSGINAPGPKVRELLRKAGLDVPYIMTGRREGEIGSTQDELRQIRSLMKEKGIRTVDQLREVLEREETLRHMLGPDVYSTFLQVALIQEQRVKYMAKKKKPALRNES